MNKSVLITACSYLVLSSLFASTTTAGIIVSSTDVPQAIPDLGMATSTLTGPNVTIADVNLILDDLRHTALLDLRFELMSPSGTNAVLVTSFWDGGLLSSILAHRADFVGTTFDDEAPVNLLTEVSNGANSPFPGSFNIDHAPTVGVSPFSVFDGESAVGIWTLKISDQTGSNSGALNGWSLDITAVPEPSYFVMELVKGAPISWANLPACCVR